MLIGQLEIKLARLHKPFTTLHLQQLSTDGWLHPVDWRMNYYRQLAAFFDANLRPGEPPPH